MSAEITGRRPQAKLHFSFMFRGIIEPVMIQDKSILINSINLLKSEDKIDWKMKFIFKEQ